MLPPAIQQRLRQWLQPSRTSAISYAVIIGLVAALAGVFLKFSSGWLGSWRVQSSTLQPAWLVLPLIGGCFGFFSGLLIQRLAPEAGGSGIPDVKASLANVSIKLSWRIALVKLVSASMALGSGLTLGRQGPTVHIGAALAGGLSRYLPMSPNHRRQLIAAGAGAGLAAAFNAPITGVLFVVEQLLQDLSGITLGTAIIASFVGAVVSRLLGGRSLQLNLELTANITSFSLGEIPFYIILGILAGLLGSLFNQGIITSLKLYQRLHVSLPLRIAIAGSVSGIAVSLLPRQFHDNTGLREFMLTGEASPYAAAIAFVAQFLLTVVAAGSGAPGGVFAPSLIMGSALGYLVGIVEYNLTGMSSPITYALAGMGAFFSVVSKVPLTAIAIVFEMTTDFNLVLPLMIGSVTSYLIAEKIAPGSLYDKLLALNGISLDIAAPTQGLLTTITAENVMQPRVETLEVQMTLDEAVQAFSRSHHRGFPVVDDGKLVGIVTQTDLAKMRELSLPGDTHLGEIMTPQPVTVSPNASLSDVLYLLDRYGVSRLPVIEQRKLIGIITRADIIHAEADKLNGRNRQIGPQPEPSYTVYQTRSPAIGQGRMLVPLANPYTANALLQFALAIARDRHYELECVQVILVSRNSSPAETPVNTAKSRRLLHQAEAEARKFNIPLHTQIRVAHDPASAILEIIKERHIDLVLMGWKGKTITPGRIFGSVADTLIRQASCGVVLVKFAQEAHQKLHFSLPTKRKVRIPPPYCLLPNTQLNRWLVPIAGGPNSQTAIQLLPSLLTLSTSPSVHFCQVVTSTGSPNTQVLEQAMRYLVRQRHLKSLVTAAPLKANSVIEGVIEQAKSENFDVVVLGASREGMLKQVISGNIPVEIALAVDCTAILVRSAISGNG